MHPYLDGHSSSLNRSLRAACFNKRKLGAILATGHQPTAMWVDRAGIKLSITEVQIRHLLGSFACVFYKLLEW